MIPYAVDASFERRPVANWLIFLGLILGFILQKKIPAVRELFVLDGWGIIGLLGHNWLHANMVHLIGNLLFLWPFGNAVCAKIGNKPYLGLYLLLCLLGGIVHLIFSSEAAFGASVAINGIVGMYIVLFPENLISCFFLLPQPVTLSILGLFVISMWFVFDIVVAMFGVQGVTYFAHIVGLGAGFGLAVWALKKKWLLMEQDEKSILQMLGWDRKETQEKVEEKESKKRPAGADTEKAAAERVIREPEKPRNKFIRFNCQCGKRIKVPAEHAGQTGRCPRCKRPLQVPEG